MANRLIRASGFKLSESTVVARRCVLSAFVLLAVCLPAGAQFQETPPAPYTPAVARQKIRTLLENGDPGNRRQTAETLSGLLVWYRDIVDDELIAAWKGDARANLPALMAPLADSRVASAIVDFSWSQQRAAAFTLRYTPMLEDLMARYPDSASPLLRDLLAPAAAGGRMPELSQPEADTLCRILLEMPDTGNWKKIALQILPHYRPSAQNLLIQDLHGNNREEIGRAQIWLAELKWNVPDPASDREEPRSRQILSPSPVVGLAPAGALSQRPHIVEQPSAPPQPHALDQFALPYSGPTSGTLKCSGAPVPPNAEYIFPGMPLGNLQIDLDGKPWDARLVPGQGQTQDLILKNKSSSPQKRCTVRWSIIP